MPITPRLIIIPPVGTAILFSTPCCSRQLREDLRREAQRLSRAEEEGKLALAKGQRELLRDRDVVREEEKQVEALRMDLEAERTKAREARDGVERERGDMLKGFSEVRVSLEVTLGDRGAGGWRLLGVILSM